jgi:hypothetical protein
VKAICSICRIILIAACGLGGDWWTLAAQTSSAAARINRVVNRTEPFPFINEQMNLKGEVSPAAGRRLYFVEMTVGATEMKGDVAAVKLVTTSGAEYSPLGVGVNAIDRVVPVDQIRLKQFWITGLPTGGTVVIAKITEAGVTISAAPQAVIAFLYELPFDAAPTGVRLPGADVIAVQP